MHKSMIGKLELIRMHNSPYPELDHTKLVDTVVSELKALLEKLGVNGASRLFEA